MRKTLVSALLALSTFGVCAQDFDDFGNMMCCFSAGLTSDGYEMDLNFSYWPVKAIGFKVALGCAGELEEVEDWDWLYDDYYYPTDDDYTVRFKFMPSIEMRTPSLIHSDGGDSSLHFFVNPGLCLSPGASGSGDAKWFCWQLRGGIELDLGALVLQAGYGYTDFYLYSGFPYSHYEYDYNPDKKTHSGFLSLGIRF